MKLKTEDEAMNNEDQRTAALSLVEKTFRGKMATSHRCLACGQESQRVDGFVDIPLAFPNSEKSSNVPQKILAGGSGTPVQTPADSSEATASADEATASSTSGSEKSFTLNDLLSFYLKPEKLDGDNKYHCEKCGKLQDAERKVHIVESPQYLILTLLRFSYDTKLQTGTKIFEDVQYPRTLALPVHRSSTSTAKDCRSSTSTTPNGFIRENNNNNDPLKSHASSLEDIKRRLSPVLDEADARNVSHRDLYGLNAVVVHSGSSSACGHYYCYARHSSPLQSLLLNSSPSHSPATLDKVDIDLANLDLLPDKWYNFNDSRVSRSNFTSFR